MSKNVLLIFIAFIFSFEVIGQVESYVKYNNDGYSSEWIYFYENGRFEIVQDEQCYRYVKYAGLYKFQDDSIQIDFFKTILSNSEVIKSQSTDQNIDFIIHVFSLQDSTAITSATVFVSDNFRKIHDFNNQVDSSGTITISLPIEKAAKYLSVYADNYVNFELVLNDEINQDYKIRIYLSEDPLLNRYYKGETYNTDFMIRKGKKHITYDGSLYRKSK